ncbi:MAG: bifunctional hydroxymethylpyrimidine kinase/phosphomethylpyrimidine kinase [Candidatus Eremiobacteraeota bacterium]|nr:bifunctional hydroxymethylpyrimidine kinase/phosphomethylpyrimidine kinase [Candidatus Eremiobacteraeota bacterium]MBC5820768.1 bifunctional hydroxymethylpyrimidine kinase/phosphomethylpyrimidine kinase [Candidatus Eremiobacteraeota bacterium]
MTVVCSVGSTDPWNAAGLGLEVQALAELGTANVWVVAGVTAQDQNGVHAAGAVAPALIAAQFDALHEADIAAFRVGVLLDAATVDVVAARLASATVPVVYDPVIGPSAGGRFIDEATLQAIRTTLLPVVDVVTPNMSEAAALCEQPVESLADMEGAARRLRALGCGAALVKGGHRAGAPVDVLADGGGTLRFEEGSRIEATLRGTGCLLAAALAAALGRGAPLHEAVRAARAFVREKIGHSQERGGMRVAY